jgi:YggT family protein
MYMKLSNFLASLVNFLVSTVVILLGLRFFLKLFGANSGNGLVSWIYQTSADVLGPFRTVFPVQNVDGYVFEFSTLFAILIYGLLGMLAYSLIESLTPAPKKRK